MPLERRTSVVLIPTFYPINGWWWTGKDRHGRSNLVPGERLWQRRLLVLWTHWKPLYAIRRGLGR